MKTPANYVLLIDKNPEVLLRQENALKCFYRGEIISVETTSKAQEHLNQKTPDVIFIDFESLSDNERAFYLHLEQKEIEAPLIVLTEKALDSKSMALYSLATAIMEKPQTATSFEQMAKTLLSERIAPKAYLPVNIPVLLRLGKGTFDLYLKLSEKNFVKIIHEGEPFQETDAEKLAAKKIYELYIREEDGPEFLKLLDNEKREDVLDPIEEITTSIQNLEAFEQVARAMGWTPEILEVAHKNVAEAVKILSKNHNILGTLKHRLRNPSSSYSRHVGLLSYLVCAFSSSLGWIGEAGQVKLAMAALIHDVAVDESYYDNIHEWNKRASDFTNRDKEILRYRMHPYEASKMMRSLDSFSPDVDQIILQHHEVMNGSGFPRGMDAKRIGHLPALFIMVEDLVEFIDDGDNIETSVIDFITWGREAYHSGHFKKIFQGFEEKLKI